MASQYYATRGAQRPSIVSPQGSADTYSGRVGTCVCVCVSVGSSTAERGAGRGVEVGRGGPILASYTYDRLTRPSGGGGKAGRCKNLSQVLLTIGPASDMN